MSRVVVLDGEAVQAVASTAHPHHRQAIAIVQVIAAPWREDHALRVAAALEQMGVAAATVAASFA